ncbi:MAG: NADH:flavin oxidoreductase/NADH oxidase [Alphaproteobacteria bacterium]|jgi:2,4-dienoyl-CoA reductase-like NADH-dependent reductase (Old Yellow Enzyme family)|nr:NADH:flavin oxidoreductase/NADH oxidase [Alphaproteobacteria bacterium]MDP6566681.1 NADH:flavin oxidoreductase/NADH oxidase [Alphaproteobacteria bacterium]
MSAAGEAETELPLLFQPITIKGMTARNRVVVPPMCQYSAVNGRPNDWHLVHYGALARGGAGLIIAEAMAVEERGRITHGDLGLWTDELAGDMTRLIEIMKRHGAVPGVQIAHAGRKAATQRPWHGLGALNEDDIARGDVPWEPVGASPLPAADGWLVPRQLAEAEIAGIVQAFADAARRAHQVGFEALEIHGAHGYLIQSFLSPLSNKRNDGYGGDLRGRMRLALEVTEAVRAAWPEDRPLFFRISSIDGFEGGWEIDDSVVLARELKALGVDCIDCSSGGNSASATASVIPRSRGFQVPYAAEVKRRAEIMTMAVGLILDGKHAEEILQSGDADLIAIGREVLYNPFWAVQAAQELGADTWFEMWPEQYGWWLDRRARSIRKYGL